MITLSVSRPSSSKLLITWTDSMYHVDNEYVLYRSLSGVKPYMPLIRGKITAFVDDERVVALNKRVSYYVVSSTGDSSEGVTVGDFNVPIVDEMVDIIEFDCRHKGGIGVNCFLVADTQKFCPNCYNQILKKIVKSDCEVCGGTGRIDSYVGPIHTFMKIASHPIQVQNDSLVERRESFIEAVKGRMPILREGDICVVPGNGCYIVNKPPENKSITAEGDGVRHIIEQRIVFKKIDDIPVVYDMMESMNGF